MHIEYISTSKTFSVVYKVYSMYYNALEIWYVYRLHWDSM